MRCKNCGTENPDGSRFCATCGKPLEQEEPAKNVAEQKEEAVQNAEEQKEEVARNTEETLTSTAETKSLTHKKSRGLNKFLIGLACAVVVVVIAAGLLISRARRTIDLNKYVTFETTGYNGYGNVYPQINWEKIQKKYDSRLKFTKEFEEQYGKNTDSISPVAVLQSYVSVEMKSDSNLSNKDKVKYNWNVNKDYAKYVKCNLKYKNKTYKVKGLEEVKTFDAFKDLEVSFNGISPGGAVSFDYTGSDLTSDSSFLHSSYSPSQPDTYNTHGKSYLHHKGFLQAATYPALHFLSLLHCPGDLKLQKESCPTPPL